MVNRIGNILFKGQLAGILEEIPGGGTRFTYKENWSTPIACCFPVERREFEWKQGLHPFFEHLGPEGRLRETQARVAHIDQEDDFGLLLKYGADCIGAVGVIPQNQGHVGAEITEAKANPGRTVSGVQKKLLVFKSGDHFQPADATGLAPYIAKFNSERTDTLVHNEALSLKWTAAVLGAEEVNKFKVAEVEGQGRALIVTRFDRDSDGKKFRLEDFSQILSKPRRRDYLGKYDGNYEDIADAINKYSALPKIDLVKLFRRLVVFSIIGNCDAHLKNFSLLESVSGLRLSPVYDVLNTVIYPELARELALSINGARIQISAVTNNDLTKFGLNIGLPKAAIEQNFTDLCRKIEAASPIIRPHENDSPDSFGNRFNEIVSNACLRILP